MPIEKPVWGPGPEVVSNAKLNQMVEYGDQKIATFPAATKFANYAATGLESRLDLDLAAGATVTLPLADASLYQRARLTLTNLGDSGTWTIALTSPNTFPGGAGTVLLAPGATLETYVGKRADGSYRWAKI